jgi:hypothetical protein
LAAVVGLAVLSALYFSQARDIKRLREWAGRAPERPRTPAGTRYVAVALAGLLVLGGSASYGVSRLTGDDGGNGSTPEHKDAAVKPGNVTVAVLNGTTVPGLAATLGDRLAAAGFKKGAIDTFSDQQLAESVVQYAPGHEAAAKAVGRRVGIGHREPVTADSRALAGDATVIVIAGADTGP